MADLLVASRRSFLGGLGALLCAPAIVRAASLMPVKALARDQLVTRLEVGYGFLYARPEWAVHSLGRDLSIAEIAREAVKQFSNSNEYIQNIATQYDDAFAAPGAKIGSTIRIRLPSDYHVRD